MASPVYRRGLASASQARTAGRMFDNVTAVPSRHEDFKGSNFGEFVALVGYTQQMLGSACSLFSVWWQLPYR
jgi:hypothetical protein